MPLYSTTSAPFELGKTLAGTDDDGNLINDHWLGYIHVFEDLDRTASKIRTGRSRRTARGIHAVALRNTSGAALLGKRLGRLARSAAATPLEYLHDVDQYANALADQGVVVIDPDLDSSGVADDDIFWGIVAGPTTILTAETGAPFNGDIALNAPLVAATFNGTTNSDAGRVSNFTAASTNTTLAFDSANNLVGFALSARTTGETATDIKVLADLRGFQ